LIELEASANNIDTQKEAKMKEISSEKAKEDQILERLNTVKTQRNQLEETLKLSQKEKLDSVKNQEMRDKLHREQMANIGAEKTVIKSHIEKLKEKLKHLELGIRGKKMEMDDLDTKLKSLVHSRSRLAAEL
jgi:seryl-tRNA(Sec) selenium transferase